jgi:hypothetical protein
MLAPPLSSHNCYSTHAHTMRTPATARPRCLIQTPPERPLLSKPCSAFSQRSCSAQPLDDRPRSFPSLRAVGSLGEEPRSRCSGLASYAGENPLLSPSRPTFSPIIALRSKNSPMLSSVVRPWRATKPPVVRSRPRVLGSTELAPAAIAASHLSLRA